MAEGNGKVLAAAAIAPGDWLVASCAVPAPLLGVVGDELSRTL